MTLSIRVDVRSESDAGREAALLSVLLPPGVVAAIDGADVVGGGGLAVVGLAAGAVILERCVNTSVLGIGVRSW